MEVSIDWQRAQDGWSRNWMAVNWAKPWIRDGQAWNMADTHGRNLMWNLTKHKSLLKRAKTSSNPASKSSFCAWASSAGYSAGCCWKLERRRRSLGFFVRVFLPDFFTYFSSYAQRVVPLLLPVLRLPRIRLSMGSENTRYSIQKAVAVARVRF